MRDPAKRGILPFLCSDYERIAYLLDNPWIDLERIIGIADGVMNISPDIGANELLNYPVHEHGPAHESRRRDLPHLGPHPQNHDSRRLL